MGVRDVLKPRELYQEPREPKSCHATMPDEDSMNSVENRAVNSGFRASIRVPQTGSAAITHRVTLTGRWSDAGAALV